MHRLLALIPVVFLVLTTCARDRDTSPLGPGVLPPDAVRPELTAAAGSATIQAGGPALFLGTDKSDYLPGETVVIIGHGWKPGETVAMVLEEEPMIHDARNLNALVDENGDFQNSEFVVEEHDRGVLFKLTVTGDGEGGVAFFTDPPPSQSGTTLTATKTASAHYTRTFQWTIDKSVTPDNWDLFRGDDGTSQYTITVTKDAGTDAAWLDGQICVTNGGAVATENLQIVDNLTMPPSQTVIASLNVDLSSNPVLDPGESQCYTYHVDIPSGSVNPGGTYKNTADVTITNHSGHLGTPFGPNPSATAILAASPTLINDNINVDDTNGGSFSFSVSGSQGYTKKFTCDDDQGNHDNTATIRETGQSDDASVTVNCYALEVTKDASTTFDRTYHWAIDKSADQSSLTLALNQSFLVNFTVLVSVTGFTDANFAVSGNIAVHNPAPIAATLNGVSDAVSGVGAATVSCGVSFPHALAAGGTLNCTYSLSLPDATDRTNTATGTLQNQSYASDGSATASGTTDFSGNASVSFGGATITDIDECIDVSDSYSSALGTVCVGDAPRTFTYGRTIGAYTTCGDQTVDNTASFDAQDTDAAGSDGWTVTVSVPCGGCSLTIGYWKTHAGFGPQADMVTPLLSQLLGTAGGTKTITVTTAAQAVGLLSFMGSNGVFDASNGINKLYAQLLAAKLNIANGADGAAIASTIAAADAFLANNNSSNWSSLSRSQKNMVLAWATTLDNYNNGVIGPGHCSQEGGTPS